MSDDSPIPSGLNGDERDSGGRFAPGNRGGPGRPRRAVELDYLKSMSAVCTPERWEKVVEAAVVAAENGDATARLWLTKHLVGEPGENEEGRRLLNVAAAEAIGTDPVEDAVDRARSDRAIAEGLGLLRKLAPE